MPITMVQELSAVSRRTTVSTFSARTLDHDGEVQAALVVNQLEKRRPDAFAHSRRVASLSTRVARLAKLPETEVRQIFWGAMVHDIGELDVPEPIFKIPGPLATIERENVDLHATIGSRWLATTPGLASLVPYARWHHERFDGTGYPDRKGGHEVPLSVALVAVCDCWDAITEPRPYRQVRPFDEAVAEMESGAGRQWSRALVQWLIDAVSRPAVGSGEADFDTHFDDDPPTGFAA
jgi:HD-GYP domain-containing protein (c-di-GMP phosphodiesterase class II)